MLSVKGGSASTLAGKMTEIPALSYPNRHSITDNKTSTLLHHSQSLEINARW